MQHFCFPIYYIFTHLKLAVNEVEHQCIFITWAIHKQHLSFTPKPLHHFPWQSAQSRAGIPCRSYAKQGVRVYCGNKYRNAGNTGFCTASAVYWASLWLAIFLGRPLAAAASARSCPWHARSRLANKKAASSTVLPTVSSLCYISCDDVPFERGHPTRDSAKCKQFYPSRAILQCSCLPLEPKQSLQRIHRLRVFRRSCMRLRYNS